MSAAIETGDLIARYRAARQRLNQGMPARQKPAPASTPAPAPLYEPVNAMRSAPYSARVLYLYPIGPTRPLKGKPIVRDVLHVASPPAEIEKASARQIMARFCRSRGVSMADLIAHRRTPELVRLRHELMWILRKRTTNSLPQIGLMLGGRDHTTIMHGVRMHEERLRAGLAEPGEW